jgi:predicted dehydrogenase
MAGRVRLLPQIGRVHLVEHEVHRTQANPGSPNWAPTWRTNRKLAGGGILFEHGAHIFYPSRDAPQSDTGSPTGGSILLTRV